LVIGFNEVVFVLVFVCRTLGLEGSGTNHSVDIDFPSTNQGNAPGTKFVQNQNQRSLLRSRVFYIIGRRVVNPLG